MELTLGAGIPVDIDLAFETDAFSFSAASCNLTIEEWGWVSYEILWRSKRVLLVEAVGQGG